MSQRQARTLDSLPTEILCNIASHAETASTLRALGLTNKRLCNVVEVQGWQQFVRDRFPSFDVPPIWKDAAHALTTLSRNFDSRSLLARPVYPRAPVRMQPGSANVSWRRPTTQTMGFQPVIDSRLELEGNSWDAHVETLAYSAGCDVLIRRTDYRRTKHNPRDTKPATSHTWQLYREPTWFQGIDDVTFLKLLPPGQESRGADDQKTTRLLMGTASGELGILAISDSRCAVQRTFDTTLTSGRRETLNNGDALLGIENPLVAACLSNTHAALYSLSGDEQITAPLDTVQCVNNADSTRLWSTKFLSESHLAVGRGVTKRPLHVYNILPSGIGASPRTFAIDGSTGDAASTVYALAPIKEPYESTRSGSRVLAAGYYNGDIRIHDLRSPRDYEAIINDRSEGSAISALLMKGREYLVAGASQHTYIKMFDLRMSGGKGYWAYDTSCKEGGLAKRDSSKRFFKAGGGISHSGWNFFANGDLQKTRRRAEGTVYSLSSPASYSPQIYAGTENTVMDLTLVNIYDRHPDPSLNSSLVRLAKGDVHVKETWLRDANQPVNISMYEQGGSLKLLNQRPAFDRTFASPPIPGYDKRWFSSPPMLSKR